MKKQAAVIAAREKWECIVGIAYEKFQIIRADNF